jgi:hypothetical protein
MGKRMRRTQLRYYYETQIVWFLIDGIGNKVTKPFYFLLKIKTIHYTTLRKPGISSGLA